MTPVCFTRVPFSSGRDLDRLHTVADLDRIDGLHAAHDAAERGVLPVQMRCCAEHDVELAPRRVGIATARHPEDAALELPVVELGVDRVARKFEDRKSTRLNSSHLGISYAVFCLKKKKNKVKYN